MRIRLFSLVALVALLLAALPTGTAGAPLPTLDIGDIVVTEPSGRNGEATVALPLTLNTTAAGPVQVGYRTVSGTAGTSDYVANTSSLTITAGSQGGGLVVEIRADRTAEPTEAFTVELTSVTGAALGDGIGLVDIRDAGTGLAVGDVALMEPDAGGVDVPIAVTVPSAPSKAVTFDWQLRAGTASVGSDVVAASGSDVIQKGSRSTIVWARVIGDAAVEATESFEIVISAVKNTSLADGIGVVTIRDDDVPPPTPSPTPTATPTPTPTATSTATPTAPPTPSPTPTPPPLAGWQPPAGSIPATGTAVYLESPEWERIGQGRNYAYTLASAVIAVDAAGDRFSIHVRGDETWDGWFAPAAAGVPLAAGTSTGLGRYPFFVPGLSWFGEGRGCNQVQGTLIIDEFVGSTVDPDRFTARFEQWCDNDDDPLRGYIRYERDDPTTPPPPGDAADFPWSPPPGAVPATGDYLYFESSPGDFVGQGRTDLYVAPEAELTGGGDISSSLVQLWVERAPSSWWSIHVIGSNTQARLLPGLYAEVGGWPFHNPVEGGFDMSGEGRSCSDPVAGFAVDSVVYGEVAIESFEIRFVQRCGPTSPPLYGAMRWTRPAT